MDDEPKIKMKAVILAAGIGRRLMPLTKDIHKSLLMLGDKSIIEEQIDDLKKCGVEDIAVVVGYKKEDIMDKLKDSVKYYINPDYEKTNTVVSLWMAKDFLKEDDVLIFNGDLLVEPAIIKELIEKESDFCTVVDVGKWNLQGYKVKVKDHKVVDMSMDFKKEEIAGEYAGMNKISKNKLKGVIEMLSRYMDEKRVDDWYETAFVSMIKEGHEMDFVDIKGRWWVEIDFKEELEKAMEHFKKKAD